MDTSLLSVADGTVGVGGSGLLVMFIIMGAIILAGVVAVGLMLASPSHERRERERRDAK